MRSTDVQIHFQEKTPFYNPKLKDKSRKMLEIIVECGNFGIYTQVYSHVRLHGLWINRIRQILKKRLSWYFELCQVVPKEATVKFLFDFNETCLEALKKSLCQRKTDSCS